MNKIFLFVAVLCLPITGFAGGVSGGGGNTKPANPVTAMDIRIAAEDARAYVLFFFNHEERRFASPDPLREKLFSGSETVTDRILAVPLTLKEAGPCLDPAGKEMDGSAISSFPQAVCISLERLTAKLSQESLRSQLFALVAHEYAHLVGATEEEAERLQLASKSSFLYGDYHGIERDYYDLRTTMNFVMPTLRQFPERLADFSWQELHDMLDRDSQENFMSPYSYNRGFILWTRSMRELLFAMEARNLLFENATCVLSGFEDAPKCRAFLNKVFQRDSEISYATYMMRLGHRNFKDWPNVKYRRVGNLETAKIEVTRVVAEFEVINAYAKTLKGLEP